MKKNENFITVVDVGSSKVCCLIAERSQDNSQELEIKGIGLHRSDGIKNGSIVDMEKVERSIRQTVQTAEKMAKVTIENIIVNFFESRYESHRFKTALNINGSEIGHQDLNKFNRKTNNCGGIEGGMSNAQPIVIRVVMKPIPTLIKPLRSIDIVSKENKLAHKERTDSCSVPAASIVAESMLCFVLADAMLEKFGTTVLKKILLRIKKFYIRPQLTTLLMVRVE